MTHRKTHVSGLADILERLDRRVNDDSMDPLIEGETLARLLSEVDGLSIPANELFQEGRSAITRRYWKKACAAYFFLRGRDLEEEIDVAAAPYPR